MSIERHNRFYFLRNRLWWVVAIGVVMFVVGGAAREWYANYTTEREIQSLEAQAKKLDARRLELLALSQKLTNGDSLEEQARLNFGLARPGETVVVVRSKTMKSAPITKEIPASNPARWLSYLLHGDRAP